MKLTAFLSFLILFPSFSFAKVDCDDHPIYCQIHRNNPTLDLKYAMNLSNIIYKAAKKHKVNARILTAIYAQESMYVNETKNCTTGIFHIEAAFVEADIPKDMKDRMLAMTAEPITVCTDFGIGQIWYRTAAKMGIDLNRIILDLEYSVDKSAEILADFYQRYGHREKDWWTRYNASSRKKRDVYLNLVERYL